MLFHRFIFFSTTIGLMKAAGCLDEFRERRDFKEIYAQAVELKRV